MRYIDLVIALKNIHSNSPFIPYLSNDFYEIYHAINPNVTFMHLYQFKYGIATYALKVFNNLLFKIWQHWIIFPYDLSDMIERDMMESDKKYDQEFNLLNIKVLITTPTT